MPKPYPLDWPKEKARTKVGERRHPAFKRLTWGTILCDLQLEVDALQGTNLVLSTGLPLRLDGRPRADSTAVDPGVAVYFNLGEMPIRDAKVTRGDVIEAHRKLMRDVHPDVGGTPEAAARINMARDNALKELR